MARWHQASSAARFPGTSPRRRGGCSTSSQPASSVIRQNLGLDACLKECSWCPGCRCLPPGTPMVRLGSVCPFGDRLVGGMPRHCGHAFQWFAHCALMTGLYVWFQLLHPWARSQRCAGAGIAAELHGALDADARSVCSAHRGRAPEDAGGIGHLLCAGDRRLHHLFRDRARRSNHQLQRVRHADARDARDPAAAPAAFTHVPCRSGSRCWLPA